MKKFISACLVFMIASGVYTQEDELNQHRYFGVGVTANIFRANELNNFDIPANRLYINIDPIKYARFDFQFGTLKIERTQTFMYFDFLGNQVEQSLDLVNKSSLWAIGAFGQYPIGDMKVYAGIRFGKSKYQSQFVDFVGPNYKVSTNRGKKKYIEPTVGFEYLFGSRFSVGGEFRMLLLEDSFTPSQANGPDISTMNITESSIFFRFYPF